MAGKLQAVSAIPSCEFAPSGWLSFADDSRAWAYQNDETPEILESLSTRRTNEFLIDSIFGHYAG